MCAVSHTQRHGEGPLQRLKCLGLSQFHAAIYGQDEDAHLSHPGRSTENANQDRQDVLWPWEGIYEYYRGLEMAQNIHSASEERSWLKTIACIHSREPAVSFKRKRRNLSGSVIVLRIARDTHKQQICLSSSPVPPSKLLREAWEPQLTSHGRPLHQQQEGSCCLALLKHYEKKSHSDTRVTPRPKTIASCCCKCRRIMPWEEWKGSWQ